MDDEYHWLLALPCPECGRVGALAGLLWGLPAGPPEGNVVLGGCVGPDFQAIHTCTACHWMGEVDSHGQVIPTTADRVLGCLLGGAIGEAPAKVITLPNIGIHGNSHMMMEDLNNDRVLKVITDWLTTNGG